MFYYLYLLLLLLLEDSFHRQNEKSFAIELQCLFVETCNIYMTFDLFYDKRDASFLEVCERRRMRYNPPTKSVHSCINEDDDQHVERLITERCWLLEQEHLKEWVSSLNYLEICKYFLPSKYCCALFYQESSTFRLVCIT